MECSPRPRYIGCLGRRSKLTYAVAFGGFCLISYWYLLPWLSDAALRLQIGDEHAHQVSPLLFGADLEKQEAVVEAFKHAWNSYERDAMGNDEYHPISHRGSNLTYSGGIGYTVADAIDTMYIMGLKHEYARARQWLKENLTFEREGNYNTFETTIRVLGGLLSAYYLTKDDIFLRRADDLASRLLSSFDTPSGLPLPMVDLAKRVGVHDQWYPSQVSTAEAATLQLEFRYLAELTGKTEYWHKAEKVIDIIDKAALPHHLVPIYMNADSGAFTHSDIRLGSRGDSYYEYLLKQYIQTNYTQQIYKKMYQESMQGLHEQLVKKTPKKHMTYIAELVPAGADYSLSPKQDHLVCFLAGSLLLGATTAGALDGGVSIPPLMQELTPQGQRDWHTGIDLLETCVATYFESETGLSPEIAMFYVDTPQDDRDWYIKNSRRGRGGSSSYDARYMLRPETVESIFIAWRLTCDARYRDYAWRIFSAIEKHCRLSGGGYATILDVDNIPVRRDDKQETFFLSETLKYLYLTFSDSDLISLKDNVFNTEAHPFPIFNPSIKPAFS